MRTLWLSGAAILFVLGEMPAPRPMVTLLTIAQRDRLRSHWSPPSASITADGRYVALASYQQLVPADDDSLADIYVIDTLTGAVTIESLAAGAAPVTASCLYPHISGDGRYLAFEVAGGAAGASPATTHIVFRDRTTGASRHISRSQAGDPIDGWSGSAMVSDDGRTVVFESSATNLVPERDENGQHPDVYLLQTDTGRIHRISLSAQGIQPPDGASTRPSLSADGRYVAFVSTAPLTSAADTQGPRRPGDPTLPVPYIHVRDLRLNATTRVNAPPGAVAPNGSSHRPAISRSGRYVAFVSNATNLVPRDGNRSSDVFLYDTHTGAITLVSRNASGRSGNGASGNPSLSADGRFVVFQSEASDLVCSRRCPPPDEDINLLADVFLFDRTTGQNTWISRGEAGGWMEESTAPVVDGSGRVVVFTSKHPSDPLDTEHDFDLFVRIAVDAR